MCGTKSPCGPGPMETSTSTAYTKVATKVPSVSWVPRSRMKFRSIRGPNWVDARVKVTRMIEKTTPTTVMTAAASVVRIWRAASALPLIIHEGTANVPRYAARSSTSVHPNSVTAPSTSRLGTTHRLVRRISRRQCEPSAEDRVARMMSPYRSAAG